MMMRISRLIGGYLIAALMASSAHAAVIDVCFDPRVNNWFDSKVQFFSGIAAIYPGGTILPSNEPIDCGAIAAPRIGKLFLNGGFVNRFPLSGPTDNAAVQFYFRMGRQAFSAAGVVQTVDEGQSYYMAITGSVNGAAQVGGQVTITNLDPTALVFQVEYPQ